MPQVNGRFVPDMKSPRTPDNEEPAAERACDFRPVDKGFTKEMALAEAERCLSEAQSFADSQPSRALEMATQAKTLAVQAAQIAQREAAEANRAVEGRALPPPPSQIDYFSVPTAVSREKR